MRHLFVATAMVIVGLVVTFGTASVLQNVAAARRDNVQIPEPVVAEQNKAPVTKQRNGEQARQVILASRRAS